MISILFKFEILKNTNNANNANNISGDNTKIEENKNHIAETSISPDIVILNKKHILTS